MHHNYRGLIVINNAGFVKDKEKVFITKTTGVFLDEVRARYRYDILLFQFLENSRVASGINNFGIDQNEFNLITVPYYNGLKKYWSYLLLIPKLFKLFLGNNAFVYIFYPGNVSYISALTCFLLNIPYGLYVRGEYRINQSSFLFKRAKFINTVGKVFKTELDQLNPNCNLIRPMVQFDFSTPIDKNRIQRINEILYVGRVETRKGIWDILKASEVLKSRLPEYKIRIVGSGLEFDEVKNHIEDSSLNNVILHGPEFDISRLAELYLQSKVFLFPSHDEGFPRVLYEAMYFKVPIITTFVGNIPGIMINGINCLKIDVKSSQSIVENIMLMTKDNFDCNELILNASATLQEVFSDDIKSHTDLLISGVQEHG